MFFYSHMNKYICHLHLNQLYQLIQICIFIAYFVFVCFYIAMGSPSRATPRLPKKHFSLLFHVLLPDFYSPSDVFALAIISFVGHFSASVLLFHVMYLGLYAKSDVKCMYLYYLYSHYFLHLNFYWLKYFYHFYIPKAHVKILDATCGHCMYF